jgi:hypothetical protein
MPRLKDPRLLLVIGVGIGALGFLFAGCFSPQWSNHYDRNQLMCAGGINDLFLYGIPYSWILGIAICIVLYAVYLMLDERHRKISN